VGADGLGFARAVELARTRGHAASGRVQRQGDGKGHPRGSGQRAGGHQRRFLAWTRARTSDRPRMAARWWAFQVRACGHSDTRRSAEFMTCWLVAMSYYPPMRRRNGYVPPAGFRPVEKRGRPLERRRSSGDCCSFMRRAPAARPEVAEHAYLKAGNRSSLRARPNVNMVDEPQPGETWRRGPRNCLLGAAARTAARRWCAAAVEAAARKTPQGQPKKAHRRRDGTRGGEGYRQRWPPAISDAAHAPQAERRKAVP